MKIKPEHYDELEKAICATVARLPLARKDYAQRGLSPMRYNWDMLWSSGFGTMSSGEWLQKNLYSYLNDDHINTALARILGNSGKDSKHGGKL